MDTFEPFKEFQFKNFIFPVKKYEEYSNGKLISKGLLNLTIIVEHLQEKIKVHLVENTLTSKIVSEFEFDLFITLNDRLQLTIYPQETNVDDALFTILKWMISYTRKKKIFTPLEPIVGHVFTDNMNIVKITFKMANPERIIEFYSYKHANMEQIKNQVNNTLKLYEAKNIPALQQQLYELYSNFNKQGGGSLVINYPEKEQLAECFTMMLRFDWMYDSDIREVWAENGFYCLIEYINSTHTNEDQIFGGLDLFLHLYFGKRDLFPQIKDILEKAKMRNEIVFDRNDYNIGAEYVINQFMFLSAQIIKPVVLKHGNILSNDVKKCFDDTLNDRTYYSLHPEEIFVKAKFISKIIEDIIKNSN